MVAHRFAKYEGLGNDFLVVEQSRFPALTPALAARLCDRHFGVGGDGVLVTGLSAEGRPFMRVINADGSAPEMCGNGLRCVALYLVERGLVTPRAEGDAFEVDTDAGPHAVRVLRADGGAQVEVRMRPASLEGCEVLGAGVPRDARGHWVDREEHFDGRAVKLTAVSMGNPHVVTFDDVLADASTLGPRIERDARFRAGANVGFATLQDAENIALTVWERGVGFTLACGTGACAAAVAAVETGRAPRGGTLHVHLPGGPLAIRVGAEGEPISMTGPARHVFDGDVAI
ncbi:MAG: diaminopimelate epimerase [Polyangiales bacterium]